MTDDDPRGCVYVSAAINPDDVRTFYEVSEATAERVRQYAGDDRATLTFDQCIETVCDELHRVLQMYGALRDSVQAFSQLPPEITEPGEQAA